MTAHVMDRYGNGDSKYAFTNATLDPQSAADWMAAQQPEARPVVLSTALALWTVLEHPKIPHRWPSGTVVMETGGFKTRRFEIDRAQLLRRLHENTGLAPDRVVREYGMTELSSQAYAPASGNADHDDLFALPHWARARALDPLTMQQRTDSEPGCSPSSISAMLPAQHRSLPKILALLPATVRPSISTAARLKPSYVVARSAPRHCWVRPQHEPASTVGPGPGRTITTKNEESVRCTVQTPV